MVGKRKEEVQELPPGNGHEEGDLPPARRGMMLGQEPLFTQDGKPTGFNVPKELMHGSDLPEEYMARTEVSEDEIGIDMRVQGLMMAFTFGIVDLDQVFKRKYNLRMSLRRQSREETVEVAKAERKFAARIQDRILGRNDGNMPRAMGGGQL